MKVHFGQKKKESDNGGNPASIVKDIDFVDAIQVEAFKQGYYSTSLRVCSE